MAEKAYSVLPYLTMLNKATPSSVYSIDAAGLKSNFLALADGSAIQDEAITIRTISPELMVLLNLSIMATVQTWELLPAAGDIEAGKCYIVTESIEDHPGGIYQSDGAETWTMLYNWVNTLLEQTDCPSSYVDEASKLLGVKSTEDGTEFVNIEAGENITLTKTAGNIKIDSSGGGGGKADFILDLPAGAWGNLPLEQDVGTNGNILRNLLDDAYANIGEAVFQIPSDIGTGDVTFEAVGYSVTAVASRNIQLRLSHSAKNTAENWDAAYSTKDSGNIATDGTQDQLNIATWTETVATLGWVASDQVRIKIGRIAPVSGINLSGHYGLTHFRIRIPRV